MLLALALLLLSAPGAASPVVPAAGTSPAAIVWEPDVVIAAPECTQTLWVESRSSLCQIAVAVDASGHLHLFTALWALDSRVGRDLRIRHYLLSDGVARELPSIPTVHAGVRTLRAATAPTGDIILLWVEERFWQPEHHPPALYFRRFRDGSWGDPIPVLDEEADPAVLHSGEFALATPADGSVHVYWNDQREYHPLVGFWSMGHAGNFAKTYRRRFTADGVGGEVEKIQKRGSYEPVTFGLLPRPDGGQDVVWSDDSNGAVKRSTLSARGWKEKDEVGQCTSRPGRPSVFSLEVAHGRDAHPAVAWTCTRYEYTEPPKNDNFFDLYVSTFDDGDWQAGPRLSRSAGEYRWLRGNDDRSFLALLEWATPPSDRRDTRRRPSLLSLKTIEGNRVVGSVSVSERAVPGLLEAATGPDGTSHVVYAELVSESEAALKYRRGTLRASP